MSAPFEAVSQSWAYAAATTVNTLTSDNYYSTCVVENGTAVTLAVAVDGGVAASGAQSHMLSCPPNTTMAFLNQLPLPDADVPGQSEALSSGWQVQRGWHGAAVMTSCSVAPQASATGTVTVSFQ